MQIIKTAVVILVLKDGKALFTKRKNVTGHGMWCMPGGHLEYKEDLKKCALRELKEETGIKAKNLRLLCVTNDVFPDRHYLTIFFVGDYASGTARIMEKEKCSDIGWFPLNKPPKPLFGGTKNAMIGKCFPKDWKAKLFTK